MQRVGSTGRLHASGMTVAKQKWWLASDIHFMHNQHSPSRCSSFAGLESVGCSAG